MNNYLLLGACFLLGILLRRSGRLPDNAAAALNGFVVHISLPALTLTYVHGLKLDDEPDPARVDGLGNVRDRMRFLLAGRAGAWFFTRYNRRAHADRRAGEHVVHWPADDRDVLWPAVSRPRNIDRPAGVILRALDPRHPGGHALLLRPQHQCEGGDPKDSLVRALSGVRAGVAANAVRIPDLARRSASGAWAPRSSQLLSYRSATSFT